MIRATSVVALLLASLTSPGCGGGQTPPSLAAQAEPTSAALAMSEIPTHCTGDKSIASFKKTFGEGYISGGTGKEIIIQ